MTAETIDQIALRILRDEFPMLPEEAMDYSHRLVDELAKQKPVAEVYRYGKDSHGREWHGVHWYDPNLNVPTGTKLVAAPVINSQGE